MLLDNIFNFADQQSISGTSDTNSTNVHDAGSAKKVFGGNGEPAKLVVHITAAGGTSPTVRARFVGADDAALTSNTIDIADSGFTPVLAAADLPYIIELKLAHQKTAKRYYGVIWDQAGTSPTATVNAQIASASQTNLVK